MYPALVAVFMPILNLLPLGYFLVRANGALANPPEDDEEPAAPSPPPRRAAAAPPARPGAAGARPARASGLRGAIACIKSASLGGQVPEGESLKARVAQPGVDMAEADLPVMRATHGHFAVCYMIDEGSHYAYANHGQVKAAGMTLEELHRLAVGNLAALVDAKPGLKMHPQPGFQGLTLDGQFEASLMLVDALWDRALAPQAPNGAVVTIPSRDVCAFCDAKSAEGVKQLRAVAARVGAGGSHVLTDKLFVRADGKWREFGAEAKKDLPPLEFGR
jgi:hypothetical protein